MAVFCAHFGDSFKHFVLGLQQPFGGKSFAAVFAQAEVDELLRFKNSVADFIKLLLITAMGKDEFENVVFSEDRVVIAEMI